MRKRPFGPLTCFSLGTDLYSGNRIRKRFKNMYFYLPIDREAMKWNKKNNVRTCGKVILNGHELRIKYAAFVSGRYAGVQFVPCCHVTKLLDM